jgi:hypothetical protein
VWVVNWRTSAATVDETGFLCRHAPKVPAEPGPCMTRDHYFIQAYAKPHCGVEKAKPNGRDVERSRLLQEAFW